MKLRVLSILIVVGLVSARVGLAGEWRWLTLGEIEDLALAIELTDFPLPSEKVKDTVGTPDSAPLLWGSTWDDQSWFQLNALTDPDSPGGYYALRTIFDGGDKPSEDVTVRSLAVVFIVPGGLKFVQQRQGSGSKQVLEILRTWMKERGLSPREFVAQGNPNPFREEELNQPPQPTPLERRG